MLSHENTPLTCEGGPWDVWCQWCSVGVVEAAGGSHRVSLLSNNS